MRILGENGLGKILKVFLQTCFIGGIILLIVWPFQLKLFGLEPNAVGLVIYPNGIALLAIVYQFIGLFDSLKNNNVRAPHAKCSYRLLIQLIVQKNVENEN